MVYILYQHQVCKEANTDYLPIHFKAPDDILAGWPSINFIPLDFIGKILFHFVYPSVIICSLDKSASL